MRIRDRGWIVVYGNTLTLTRLWQSCLATDTAENSVLQLLSDVECHLMLSMTQNLFSFFIPNPVPRAGIPNSSDPLKRAWSPLTALSWGLSIHPHGFFKVDLQQTAVLLWHCVPFSHSPIPGQLWASRDETLSYTPESLVMVL